MFPLSGRRPFEFAPDREEERSQLALVVPQEHEDETHAVDELDDVESCCPQCGFVARRFWPVCFRKDLVDEATQRALNRFGRSHYRVVLVEHKLPEKEGLELVIQGLELHDYKHVLPVERGGWLGWHSATNFSASEASRSGSGSPNCMARWNGEA